MVTWIIVLIFVVMSVLMLTKKLSAMFALPIMALLIALAAGIPWDNVVEGEKTIPGIATLLFTEGPIRLSSAMMMLIFGAILSQVVKNTGIAETTVRKVSELAGDRALVLAIAFIIILSVLFTTLGGLGSVIMIGTIVIPIMISVGIKPEIAGCVLLISLSTGGIFNLANWGLYTDALALTVEQIRSYAFVVGGLYIVMAIVFTVVEVKFGGIHLFRKKKVAWPAPTEKASADTAVAAGYKKVNILAVLTPLIPLVLVIAFKWEIVPAFVVGILYGLITTIGKGSLNMLSKSVIQGISDSAGALFLMIGIGMLLKVVMDPRVTAYIGPAIASIMPSSGIVYILFFSILAPLALYRGPLNLWGLGLGIAALMMTSGKLQPMAIMAALLTTGQLQGICDPTNTHNVWTASATSVDTSDILKKTLPYVWITAIIGLIIAGIMYF